MIIYFKWLLFLVINLVTNLLSLPLTPIVVIFSYKVKCMPDWLFASNDGWLPNWLYYFQTPDNSLDGDSGWKITHPKSTYWNRCRWLWRNRLYGFSRSVLSVHYQPSQGDYLLITGDADIGNQGILAKSGNYHKHIYDKHSKLTGFEYYFIRQYKRWPDKCIRVLIGWKCPDRGEGDTVCTFGFSPNFWQHFGP